MSMFNKNKKNKKEKDAVVEKIEQLVREIGDKNTEILMLKTDIEKLKIEKEETLEFWKNNVFHEIDRGKNELRALILKSQNTILEDMKSITEHMAVDEQQYKEIIGRYIEEKKQKDVITVDEQKYKGIIERLTGEIIALKEKGTRLMTDYDMLYEAYTQQRKGAFSILKKLKECGFDLPEDIEQLLECNLENLDGEQKEKQQPIITEKQNVEPVTIKKEKKHRVKKVKKYNEKLLGKRIENDIVNQVRQKRPSYRQINFFNKPMHDITLKIKESTISVFDGKELKKLISEVFSKYKISSYYLYAYILYFVCAGHLTKKYNSYTVIKESFHEVK